NDAVLAEHKPGEDVTPTPGTDDAKTAAWPEVMNEVGNVIFEIIDLAKVAIKFHKGSASQGIDLKPVVPRLALAAVGRTKAPGYPPAGARRHGQPGERVQALVDWSRP